MRMIGKAPSRLNPLFCKNCLDDAPLGGAEIELTMLFDDVRGSTTLAEKLQPEYRSMKGNLPCTPSSANLATCTGVI
jgi:hypothetical protein